MFCEEKEVKRKIGFVGLMPRPTFYHCWRGLFFGIHPCKRFKGSTFVFSRVFLLRLSKHRAHECVLVIWLKLLMMSLIINCFNSNVQVLARCDISTKTGQGWGKMWCGMMRGDKKVDDNVTQWYQIKKTSLWTSHCNSAHTHKPSRSTTHYFM